MLEPIGVAEVRRFFSPLAVAVRTERTDLNVEEPSHTYEHAPYRAGTQHCPVPE